MNNIQKSFRNKAKMGLHMATGGFISTVPDAGFGGRSPGLANTSPFDNGGGTITGLGGGLQRMSLGGGSAPAATPSAPAPAGGLKPNQPANRDPNQPVSTLNKLNDGISFGNAVGNSNMTMGEKAALGLGTTAADASALRNQVAAATSLRDGMAQNMADGGVVETPDQLMARMAAKYGGSAAAATRPAEPAPAPQAAAPTPAPQSGGLLQRAVRGMSSRAAQIEAATNYAEGGIVRGKGGVDKVPMNISGVDVNLTGGKTPEAVLPSKTVQALGGPEEVEELIERTNGKPPVKSGLRAGGRYASGYVTGNQADDESTAGYVPTGARLAAYKEAAQPAALTPEQQVHQRILNDPTGGVGKIPGLMTPQQKQAAITVNAPVQAEAIQSAKDQPNADVYQRVTGDQTLPKGLRASIDQGGGRRLDFNSPNNVANQTIDARRYQADGEGVASMRQPDGSFRNVVLGASGNAQPQGPVRLDAHGNNMAATDQMQNTLRNMQHDRLMRDLGGDIKDPRVTQAAMLGLNQMNKDAELGNERSRYAGEQAYKIADLGLRRDQNKLSQANIDADNRRADATLRDKQVGEVDKTLSDMIEKIVPTAGLKDDDLKTAQVKQAEIRQATLEAYGGQLPPDVATLQKDLVGRVTQGRLTANANEAMRKRGPIDKLRNLFSGNVRPTTSLSPNTDLGDRDWLRLEYAGVPLFPDDVFHGDADLMAAYDERRAKQRELKTLKNNAAR